MRTYWVYILACSNGSYYTGYTTDLDKRFKLHVDGRACKYTRSFKPLAIAQSWELIGCRSKAMKLESAIKKLSREQKERIIANPNLISLDLLDA